MSKQNYTTTSPTFPSALHHKESNFLKSPAYCESTKHYCCLHVAHDAMLCTQSVQRFRDQSAGYDNGCFSAVNRVWHLYSDNCDLKYHGNSIEFKYGWNFVIAHQWLYWNKASPRSCLLCSSWLARGWHSVARVPALRDCSCQIDAKANENIGLDLKPATILQNASLWNTQTCEFVATWAPETSQIWPCLLPVFRYCHWEWYVFNHKYLKNDRGGDRGRPFQLKV